MEKDLLLILFSKTLKRVLHLLPGMRRRKKLKYKHQLLQKKDTVESFGHLSVTDSVGHYQVEGIPVTSI